MDKQVQQEEAAAEVVTAYKGFDANWKCRGFQYAVGQSYEHTGAVEACRNGFHACEHPLDVFSYYSPVGNRFAVVEQSGALSRHDEDTKIASSRIAIKAEIGIPALITAAFEFVKSRCEPAKDAHDTGDSSASSATGYSSASSATGDSSASSATGDRSASSATGDSSASSATGDSSASLTTGDNSTSQILPAEDGALLYAVAIALGSDSTARAPLGSAIVLTHRDDKGAIVHIRASKIGDNGLKPMVWYSLDASGEFVEAPQ